MCGIVGYIGEKKAAPILVEGLRRLEYRGYDSAGIATVNNNEISIKKDIGKIEEIKELDIGEGNLGICHCRWATHGKVTKENAHPHSTGKIALVHNGIIENYAEIKKKLEENKVNFDSETDSEVIVRLIEFYYNGNLKEAVIKALNELEGAYSLGIVCKDDPDKIIAARNESPLIIGIGENENFIASDVPAILKHTRKVLYLENKEVAVLTKELVQVYDLENNEVKKKIHKINWNSERAEKGGYEHFMLKEIFEQSDVISESVEGIITDDDINLDIGISEKEVKDIKRIIIVGCGTSWHSALVGEFMLEELARIPTEVEYASEFRYRDPIINGNTIVIAISQSGETADTLAAMREAKKKGAKIISIVNVTGSSIARESDFVLYTKAGPEIGVASTKAFTTQLVMLYLMTVKIANIKGNLDREQLKNRIRDLRLIPLQIKSVLEERNDIEKLAKKFYKKNNALYLGRGINYPIALEGALKLKEVSYLHAEGYPAAEMKHGPIALIDKHMPVMFIATKDDRTYKKILSNIEEVKARNGEVIGIITKGDEEVQKTVDFYLPVPENSYILTPLLATIPLQLFAYYTAIFRGHNPDKPRNLAKSVTVE